MRNAGFSAVIFGVVVLPANALAQIREGALEPFKENNGQRCWLDKNAFDHVAGQLKSLPEADQARFSQLKESELRERIAPYLKAKWEQGKGGGLSMDDIKDLNLRYFLDPPRDFVGITIRATNGMKVQAVQTGGKRFEMPLGSEPNSEPFLVPAPTSAFVVEGISGTIPFTLVIGDAEHRSRLSFDLGLVEKGKVEVKSQPDHAVIFVDDGDTTRTTKDKFIYPAGEHTLKLKKDGYKDWSCKIKVKGDEAVVVDAILEKE
jgi:hypothetical protein